MSNFCVQFQLAKCVGVRVELTEREIVSLLVTLFERERDGKLALGVRL